MTIAEITAELDRIESMDAETRQNETEYLREVYAELMKGARK